MSAHTSMIEICHFTKNELYLVKTYFFRRTRFGVRIRLLQLLVRLPSFRNGFCVEGVVGVVCGGRGLAQGFNLVFVFCKIVSKSVCDLYCN